MGVTRSNPSQPPELIVTGAELVAAANSPEVTRQLVLVMNPAPLATLMDEEPKEGVAQRATYGLMVPDVRIALEYRRLVAEAPFMETGTETAALFTTVCPERNVSCPEPLTTAPVSNPVGYHEMGWLMVTVAPEAMVTVPWRYRGRVNVREESAWRVADDSTSDGVPTVTKADTFQAPPESISSVPLPMNWPVTGSTRVVPLPK